MYAFRRGNSRESIESHQHQNDRPIHHPTRRSSEDFRPPLAKKICMSEQYVRPEIGAMDGYVPGEQPQAGKFIKLNTNENPYPPPPGIRGAIDEVLQRGLQKYPDPMASAFRMRAAQIHELPSKDWVLCG